MHPRMPLAFLAARAHCWLMVNLSSTSTPRSFSAELLSSRSAPSLYWCIGLFLPRCRTLCLLLLNLIRFLSAQLFSSQTPFRAHWKINFLTALIIYAELLTIHIKVHFCFSCSSIEVSGTCGSVLLLKTQTVCFSSPPSHLSSSACIIVVAIGREDDN